MRSGSVDARAGSVGHVGESPTSQVAKDQASLAIACACAETIDLRVDVAIGREEITPSVIVEIPEKHSPAEIRQACLSYACGEGRVGEIAGALVSEERVSFLGEVGHAYVESAVVVIIADGDAHSRARLAVGVQRRA